MPAKILIVLLILLLILGLAGTAMGFARDDQPHIPAWLSTLESLLVPRQPLRAQDLFLVAPPACRDLFTTSQLPLPPAGRCDYFIQSSDAALRTLRIRRIQGAVAVSFQPQEPDRMSLHKTLTQEKPTLTLSIFSQGGRLTLVCASPMPCVLQREAKP